MIADSNNSLSDAKALTPPGKYLVDTTLRDGEQKPGVAFSASAKREIAKRLAALGIAELEIGIPAMGDEEVATMQSIARLGLPVRLTAWCRAVAGDIEAASRSGVDAIHLSLPVSTVQINTLGKSSQWVFESLGKSVEMAGKYFDYISIGAQDASRADRALLCRFVTEAANLGVDRVRLADTVGVLSPLRTFEIIDHLYKMSLPIEIGFHAHNDLGMATANTVAAIAAGADCADVTVLGIGERAGNAALEQVVMASEMGHLPKLDVDCSRLSGICHLVAEAAGVVIADDQPIVGAGIFRHESGIHVDAIRRNPKTYEPFSPEKTGHAGREIRLGKHSGSRAVQFVVEESLGISIDRNQAERLLGELRKSFADCD